MRKLESLAPVLLLFACTASAQSIDALVSKGGLVHLTSSYQLNHTLLIPPNTQLTCDPGVKLSEAPMLKLNSLLQITGKGVHVEGCGIDSSGTSVILALGPHSSGIFLLHNHLNGNNQAHGIIIDAPDIHDVTIENNIFEDVKYGILQNVHAADLTNVLIDGNTFTNIWADAIELNNPVTNDCCGMRLGDVRASHVTIRGNTFRVPKHAGSGGGAGFCVGIAGAHDIEISGNDCVAWNAGIHVEDRAYNIRITGNSVLTDDHGTTGEQSAIWINDGQHIVISHNRIRDSAADGVHVDFTVGHQASDMEINDNEIIGCGRYGMFISGGSLGPMNSSVHDNTVTGCAKPIVLIGKLNSLSIHANSLDAKNGSVFDTSQNKGEVDIGDNKDVNSGGDANTTCGR
jgi:hypothetical protein